MKVQVKYLKVKIKSLAAESGIIRLEERRSLGRRLSDVKYDRDGNVRPMWREFIGRDDALYTSLRQHRVIEVRQEQRSSLLAYAFLRGRDYRQCECPAADNKPDLDRVMSLVKKFGPAGNIWTKGTLERMLAEWVAGTLADNPFAKPPKLAKTA